MYVDNRAEMAPGSFLADIQALGQPGYFFARRPEGFLISNDKGYAAIADEMIAAVPAEDGSVGLFVGSGGVLSMLPELPIDTAVMVDENPCVNELTGLLAQLIQAYDSPEEALGYLVSDEARTQNHVIGEFCELFGSLKMLFTALSDEAENYGRLHWTQPDRFTAIKAALETKNIITINSQLQDPTLATGLTQALQKHGQQLTFLNLTNVQYHITKESMDFLRTWPAHPNAVFMYSVMAIDKTKHLGIRYQTSLDEYLAASGRSLDLRS
jgi:hypothetical protein